MRDGQEFHHSHGVGQFLELFTLSCVNVAERRAALFAAGVWKTKRLQQRVRHAHESEMAGNEIVNLPAFALHAFACGLEIKISRAQNDVREEFKELNHGLLFWHGHHSMKGVR